MIYLVEAVFLMFFLTFFTVMYASWWTVFEKAQQPGWSIFVPVYNLVVMLQMTGKPMWWLVFFLVPCLNMAAIVFVIMIYIELGNRFGKGGGFIAGLILLPYVFIPILAFGKSEYTPPPPQPA